MDTALGLIGLLAYAAAIIGLAAGVTWLVVKISPSEKPAKPEPATDDADETASDQAGETRERRRGHPQRRFPSRCR